MALVTQNVTPTRSYSPFEGMSERARLQNAVPRGMVRFFSDEALDAKPINDDLVINFTCSLPPSFAYVISAVSYTAVVDRAADFTPVTRLRVFNGLPNGTPGNEQVMPGNLSLSAPGAGIWVGTLILDQSLGHPRDFFPQPLVKTPAAAGMSFIMNVANGSDTAQLAGTQFFNASFYQYELNQALRFPLNFPLPVGIR